MKKSKKSIIAKIRAKVDLQSIIGYLLGGGVWFWSGYILIVLLDGPLGEIFGESMGLFLANFIGNTVGFTLNFLILRYWAFKSKNPASLGVATTKYVVYTVVNVYGLNYLILLGLKQIGIEPEIGQFIASAFFTVWNYFWYKNYVFKESGGKPETAKKHKKSTPPKR